MTDLFREFRMQHSFDLDLWADAQLAKIKSMADDARRALDLPVDGPRDRNGNSMRAMTRFEVDGMRNQSRAAMQQALHSYNQSPNFLYMLGFENAFSPPRCRCCGR